jgi:pimeloyl-ACP methyl ester carboxylesterase
LLALWLAGCASHVAGAPPVVVVPRVSLQPCAVRDVGRPAFCGVAEVPEDRDARSGRVVALDVVVVPAQDREHARPDPVFVLAGGPGQAATDATADFAEVFAGALAERDFVFVDQRGTGRRSPMRCALVGEDGDLGTLAGGDLPEDRLRACLAHLDARPELYTTDLAVDDLDEVAARLGYEAVDVLAGSYGTTVALQLVRRHPSRVRAVVLDGVVPPDREYVVPFARNAQRALDTLLAECAGDPVCRADFPDPGADMRAALARLATAPVRVTAPVEGAQRATATLDASAFAMAVRQLLYSPATRGLVPAVLHAAAAGEDAALAPFVVSAGRAIARDLSVGMYLTVTCSEDLPGIDADAARRDTEGTFLGMARVGPTLRACGFWPHRVVDASARQAVRSDVPALMLSGTADPATAIEWAEGARGSLPNARSLVVPGGGHGVADVGCVPGLVKRFLDAPEEAIDASCVARVSTRFARSLRAADRR